MGWYVAIWLGLIALLAIWQIRILRGGKRGGSKRVMLDQLRHEHRLGEGEAYVLFLFRQSGNEYREKEAFYSLPEALGAAISTMNRAGIEEVRIVQNTEDRFEVERAVHDHRGKAEGKKVGSFEIVRIV